MTGIDSFIRENRAVVERLFAGIEARQDDMVARVRDLAETPSPTFDEARRSEYLMDAFPGAGLRDVHRLPLGSVMGFTHDGAAPIRLLLAAHIDTVFPAGTDLATRMEGAILRGPGTGDNAANVAAITTLAELLTETGCRTAGNVAFCGTVREEGLGNLGGMAEVLDEAGARTAMAIAVDGLTPNVTNRSQAIRRYAVTARGPGGHSWNHFGAPSAVHEMGRLISALAALEVPAEPRTTFNVGTISGGTSVNAIAQECRAEVDLRSLEQDTLERLEREFLKAVSEVPRGVDMSTELIGTRPGAVIDPGHRLVETAMAAGDHLGVGPALNASSTDAALALARGIPAIAMGAYRGGGTHTLEEYVDTSSLTTGLKWLALAVLALAGVSD